MLAELDGREGHISGTFDGNVVHVPLVGQCGTVAGLCANGKRLAAVDGRDGLGGQIARDDGNFHGAQRGAGGQPRGIAHLDAQHGAVRGHSPRAGVRGTPILQHGFGAIDVGLDEAERLLAFHAAHDFGRHGGGGTRRGGNVAGQLNAKFGVILEIAVSDADGRKRLLRRFVARSAGNGIHRDVAGAGHARKAQAGHIGAHNQNLGRGPAGQANRGHAGADVNRLGGIADVQAVAERAVVAAANDQVLRSAHHERAVDRLDAVAEVDHFHIARREGVTVNEHRALALEHDLLQGVAAVERAGVKALDAFGQHHALKVGQVANGLVIDVFGAIGNFKFGGLDGRQRKKQVLAGIQRLAVVVRRALFVGHVAVQHVVLRRVHRVVLGYRDFRKVVATREDGVEAALQARADVHLHERVVVGERAVTDAGNRVRQNDLE